MCVTGVPPERTGENEVNVEIEHEVKDICFRYYACD